MDWNFYANAAAGYGHHQGGQQRRHDPTGMYDNNNNHAMAHQHQRLQPNDDRDTEIGRLTAENDLLKQQLEQMQQQQARPKRSRPPSASKKRGLPKASGNKRAKQQAKETDSDDDEDDSEEEEEDSEEESSDDEQQSGEPVVDVPPLPTGTGKLVVPRMKSSTFGANPTPKLTGYGLIDGRSNAEAAFAQKCQLLKEFRQEYPDMKLTAQTDKETLPEKYRKLPNFIGKQHKHYRYFVLGKPFGVDGYTDQQRIDTLTECGMEWPSMETVETKWDRNYAALKAFYDEHGHAVLPDRPEYVKLKRWVSQQQGALNKWRVKLQQAEEKEETADGNNPQDNNKKDDDDDNKNKRDDDVVDDAPADKDDSTAADKATEDSTTPTQKKRRLPYDSVYAPEALPRYFNEEKARLLNQIQCASLHNLNVQMRGKLTVQVPKTRSLTPSKTHRSFTFSTGTVAWYQSLEAFRRYVREHGGKGKDTFEDDTGGVPSWFVPPVVDSRRRYRKRKKSKSNNAAPNDNAEEQEEEEEENDDTPTTVTNHQQKDDATLYLGNWVKVQLRLYHLIQEGLIEKHPLLMKQMELLKDAGFEFDQAKWDEALEHRRSLLAEKRTREEMAKKETVHDKLAKAQEEAAKAETAKQNAMEQLQDAKRQAQQLRAHAKKEANAIVRAADANGRALCKEAQSKLAEAETTEKETAQQVQQLKKLVKKDGRGKMVQVKPRGPKPGGLAKVVDFSHYKMPNGEVLTFYAVEYVETGVVEKNVDGLFVTHQEEQENDDDDEEEKEEETAAEEEPSKVQDTATTTKEASIAQRTREATAKNPTQEEPRLTALTTAAAKMLRPRGQQAAPAPKRAPGRPRTHPQKYS